MWTSAGIQACGLGVEKWSGLAIFNGPSVKTEVNVNSLKTDYLDQWPSEDNNVVKTIT